jgi:hypothetical protein
VSYRVGQSGTCPLHHVGLIRRRPPTRNVTNLRVCPIAGCDYWAALVFGIETTHPGGGVRL